MPYPALLMLLHSALHLTLISPRAVASVCSCPLCRYALPTTGTKVGEELRVQQERKELHEAMFN